MGGVLALPVEARRAHRVVPVHRGRREAGVRLLQGDEEDVDVLLLHEEDAGLEAGDLAGLLADDPEGGEDFFLAVAGVDVEGDRVGRPSTARRLRRRYAQGEWLDGLPRERQIAALVLEEVEELGELGAESGVLAGGGER